MNRCPENRPSHIWPQTWPLVSEQRSSASTCCGIYGDATQSGLLPEMAYAGILSRCSRSIKVSGSKTFKDIKNPQDSFGPASRCQHIIPYRRSYGMESFRTRLKAMFNFGLNTLQSSYLIDPVLKHTEKSRWVLIFCSWLQEKSRNAEGWPGSSFQLGTLCWLDVSKSKGRKASLFWTVHCCQHYKWMSEAAASLRFQKEFHGIRPHRHWGDMTTWNTHPSHSRYASVSIGEEILWKCAWSGEGVAASG